jgi:hypothetical protein
MKPANCDNNIFQHPVSLVSRLIHSATPAETCRVLTNGRLRGHVSRRLLGYNAVWLLLEPTFRRNISLLLQM